jgi:hypothetical protein
MWLLYGKSQSEVINEYLYVALIFQLQSRIINEYLCYHISNLKVK